MGHEHAWEFIENFDSVVMASVNDVGAPHVSYAPFVEENRRFYICISAMAHHTKNLLQNPKASLMMVEDETESKNSFARRRVTFDTHVAVIPRSASRFAEIMMLFREKFGDKASIYEQMSDFTLFELVPYGGRAVFGFGEAYDLKDGDFGALNGEGHTTKQ